MNDIRIVTRSQTETENLGLRLGMFLKTHGRATVCLYGDLGAGKTTLIRGIASAFGIPARDIGSASFVIIAEHDTTPPFYHIDLYRLEGEEDIDTSGVWEYIDTEGIAVIEWAERLPEIPENAIRVKINYIAENLREIFIEGVESFFLTQ